MGHDQHYARFFGWGFAWITYQIIQFRSFTTLV